MERLCLKCLHEGGDPPHEGGGMEERTGDQREREQTPTFQRAGGVVQLQGPCVSCFWQQMHEAEGASKRSRRCESLSVCEYLVYVWVCSSATARHETLWGD